MLGKNWTTAEKIFGELFVHRGAKPTDEPTWGWADLDIIHAALDGGWRTADGMGVVEGEQPSFNGCKDSYKKYLKSNYNIDVKWPKVLMVDGDVAHWEQLFSKYRENDLNPWQIVVQVKKAVSNPYTPSPRYRAIKSKLIEKYPEYSSSFSSSTSPPATKNFAGSQDGMRFDQSSPRYEDSPHNDGETKELGKLSPALQSASNASTLVPAFSPPHSDLLQRDMHPRYEGERLAHQLPFGKTLPYNSPTASMIEHYKGPEAGLRTEVPKGIHTSDTTTNINAYHNFSKPTPPRSGTSGDKEQHLDGVYLDEQKPHRGISRMPPHSKHLEKDNDPRESTMWLPIQHPEPGTIATSQWPSRSSSKEPRSMAPWTLPEKLSVDRFTDGRCDNVRRQYPAQTQDDEVPNEEIEEHFTQKDPSRMSIQYPESVNTYVTQVRSYDQDKPFNANAGGDKSDYSQLRSSPLMTRQDRPDHYLSGSTFATTDTHHSSILGSPPSRMVNQFDKLAKDINRLCLEHAAILESVSYCDNNVQEPDHQNHMLIIFVSLKE